LEGGGRQQVATAGEGARAAVRGGQAPEGNDRTVTKVVKMLEKMLEQSKADGDTDRKLYAKFLCYCNQKKDAKTKEIADLTFVIGRLENTIAELRGSTGGLSTEVAQLKADIAENKQQQDMLTSIRKKENAAYVANEADLTAAIQQMDGAIRTLAEVGADQTLGEAAADHSQFMAKYSFVGIQERKAKVQEAIASVTAFLGEQQKRSVQSFLQAPFTGTYTAQSGEVVGILKSMRDTFKANLASATEAEAAAQKQYDALMATLQAASTQMAGLYEEKQGSMGSNDGSLATRTEQLADATKEKAIREDFLAELIPMCNKKAEAYQERNEMRANEDAAVSEAISILNKDSAFATFGAVSATSTGFLLQLHSTSAVVSNRLNDVKRQQAQRLLQRVAVSQKSLRLIKIVALLEAGNPFTQVLKAMDKLLGVIAAEGKADADNLEWCNTERATSDAKVNDLDAEIMALDSAIKELLTEIDAPDDGLKARIATTEISLKENYHSQTTQTEQRQEENLAYQADIKNLMQASSLLNSAIHVLGKYYKQIVDDSGVVYEEQTALSGETEAPPESWQGTYKGQSDGGNKALEMLEYILKQTESEEKAAHTSEKDAQFEFEKSMEELKTEEASLQASLAQLKEALAEKEKELAEKEAVLKKSEAELDAVKAYIAEIKPGCDFITENIQYRDNSRAKESDALTKGKELIKGTPAYQAAVAEAHLDKLGECKDICVKAGEDHVECKACLAKVEIPGYCAGHPDTMGC
jgi:hypothetical protein